MDVVAIPASRSPWLTLWTDPRTTIRRIVAAPSRRSGWIIIALTLLAQTLSHLEFDASGVNFVLSIRLIAVAIAMMLYWIGVVPFLLALSGKWAGVNGEPRNIRQAIVWSYLPDTVFKLCCWPVGLGLILSQPDTEVSKLTSIGSQINHVGQLWSVAILISMLAELLRVRRFAVIHAIASVGVVLFLSLFVLRLSLRLLL